MKLVLEYEVEDISGSSLTITRTFESESVSKAREELLNNIKSAFHLGLPQDEIIRLEFCKIPVRLSEVVQRDALLWTNTEDQYYLLLKPDDIEISILTLDEWFQKHLVK
jgi:hypothetical protein